LTDPNASAAQQAVLQQHLNSLTYSPFGDSPLFRNPMSDPKKKEEVNFFKNFYWERLKMIYLPKRQQLTDISK
jgi:hypothetical protein